MCLKSFLLVNLNKDCGVSVSHTSEGHVHETHGHKTSTSSEHGEKKQEDEHQGIGLIGTVVVAAANCSSPVVVEICSR